MDRQWVLSVSVLVTTTVLCACVGGSGRQTRSVSLGGLEGEYLGQQAPSFSAEVFLPNVISTELEERCVTFLDGGTVCVFTTDDEGTYYTSMRNGGWADAKPFPFNYRNDMLDSTAGPDGRSLVFMTSRPVGSEDPGATHHLWTAEWNGSVWNEPIPLDAPEKVEGIGAGYPTLAANGTLYFISDARDGSDEGGIFRCRIVNGEYTKAKLVEYPINTRYIDFDPYIAPDESYIVFNSNRPGGFGMWDTYVSFKRPDGGWTSAINLGSEFNTEYSEACPNVTADGKFLFFASRRPTSFLSDITDNTFASGRDLYWSTTRIIQKNRKRYIDSESSLEEIRGVYLESGVEVAVQRLQFIYKERFNDFSFEPNELLKLCDEILTNGANEDADALYSALIETMRSDLELKLGYSALCALNSRMEESSVLLRDLDLELTEFNLEYAVIYVGNLLHQASMKGEESSLYETFLEDLPDSYRILLYLAEACESLGKIDEASVACERALELNPDHPRLKSMSERLRTGASG